MTQLEISALENAGRASMAWSPEGYDGRTHYATVLTAMIPAFAILVAAAALLFHII